MQCTAVLLVLTLSLHPSASDDNSDIPHFPYGYSKCQNPGVGGLHCSDFDLAISEQDVQHNMCKCRCGDLTPLVVDDLFKSSANCVRIKAEGDTKNPGGYLFTLDNFDTVKHHVYHDLWFKKNKNTHRALSGSFWRIYYPWVNASATADNIPYAVQNILTTQFLTAMRNVYKKNWNEVQTVPKLNQKGMWKFNSRKRNGKTQWSLQNQQTNEYLIMHATDVAEQGWQGRILTHNKKKWDGFPEGEWFFIHPCY
uniref:Putative conserved secreted protein n=1 Tax=Culex tarsalis TaxID=7177 RepID=A0A1Q3G051_CULTA